jgi:rod shape-determining protein MreC
LDLVPLDAEISAGQTLVTSGLEGVFPPGLLVGTITSAKRSDVQPFQTAEVTPFFDPAHTETLFVITGYQRQPSLSQTDPGH